MGLESLRGPSALECIKQGLDANGRCIVFERKTAQSSMEAFADLAGVLSDNAAAILGSALHTDGPTGRLYLVVQLDPEQADVVQRAVMRARLPHDVATYFYLT